MKKLNELKHSQKMRFTRYDFVACDELTTGLRHELFRLNQTYNSLTTVVYVTKKRCRKILKHVLKSYNNRRYRQEGCVRFALHA